MKEEVKNNLRFLIIKFGVEKHKVVEQFIDSKIFRRGHCLDFGGGDTSRCNQKKYRFEVHLNGIDCNDQNGFFQVIRSGLEFSR